MNFDVSWRNPTEVKLAVLDHVCTVLNVPDSKPPRRKQQGFQPEVS
jgi:hypothetical protein